jgi:hypothetical protein
MKCMKTIALEHYRTHAIDEDIEKLVPHNTSPWMFRSGRLKRCRIPIIVALILSGVRFLRLQDGNGLFVRNWNVPSYEDCS